MGEDEVYRSAEGFVADRADVVVYADSDQAQQDVVGRAVEVGAPFAPCHPHSRSRELWFRGSRDGLLASDHNAAAGLARLTCGLLIGAGHDDNCMHWTCARISAWP
jgi:hypothetical protein